MAGQALQLAAVSLDNLNSNNKGSSPLLAVFLEAEPAVVFSVLPNQLLQLLPVGFLVELRNLQHSSHKVDRYSVVDRRFLARKTTL